MQRVLDEGLGRARQFLTVELVPEDAVVCLLQFAQEFGEMKKGVMPFWKDGGEEGRGKCDLTPEPAYHVCFTHGTKQRSPAPHVAPTHADGDQGDEAPAALNDAITPYPIAERAEDSNSDLLGREDVGAYYDRDHLDGEVDGVFLRIGSCLKKIHHQIAERCHRASSTDERRSRGYIAGFRGGEVRHALDLKPCPAPSM